MQGIRGYCHIYRSLQVLCKLNPRKPLCGSVESPRNKRSPGDRPELVTVD